MDIIVKVDTKRTKDPVAHVRRVLGAVPGSRAVTVEEVFPDLRTGASAGLLSVHLPCDPGSKAHRLSVRALRDDEAVVYVEGPKRRRPL
ncbi:MAG: hypothetical protein A2X52_03485 [Candidatus Rokubacteria bacterium GWC2_70_16]|nr:MAG: hypothetical protein A2X52_03485 [Candidatus Rokubacteria bacterium GWC2_70_16]OGL17359.1 MAG: hypothetical protein A3K12_05870 [Candidatus Rokubacteria bacterium RIFCSPLOWO2_12_FULL_71_19]